MRVGGKVTGVFHIYLSSKGGHDFGGTFGLDEASFVGRIVLNEEGLIRLGKQDQVLVLWICVPSSPRNKKIRRRGDNEPRFD